MSLAMAMVSHHNFQNFVLNTYKTTIFNVVVNPETL